MGKNQIEVDIVVDDNGSLSKVAKNSAKAAAGIDKVTKSTNKASKSKDRYNKTEKGVAGATSNSTKAFSKQAQSIGGSSGLVAAYATLAANIFAITAAFGALKRSAALEQLSAGLIHVGTAAGANLPAVADSLVEITDAAISTKEAMTAVALGTSAGFSTSQMEGLTKVAKGASLALGRDMADAMSRLTRGAAKLEPEILDELGIMVRLDDATEAYAGTLGKTAAQLTQFERRMAFTNAIIEQGREKFGAIADSIDANPYDKLSATFENLTQIVFKLANVALLPIAETLANNLGVLTAALILFGTAIMRGVLPQVAKLGAASAAAAATAASAAAKASGAIVKVHTANMKKMGSALPDFSIVGKKVQEQEKHLRSGTASTSEYNTAIKNTTASIKGRERALSAEAVKNRGWGKERIALKEQELAIAMNLRVELQKMQAAEAGRSKTRGAGASTVAASRAKDSARISGLGARGLNEMQGAGLKDSFKNLAKYSKLAFKSATQATGAVGKFKAATQALTITTKLFGAALLNAIPVVGQIISAFFILQSIFDSLFPNAFADQVDEYAETFENFAEVSNKLAVAQITAKDANAAFMVTLNASVGIIDQVETALLNLNATSLAKLRKEISSTALEIEKIKKITEDNLSDSDQYKWWYAILPDSVVMSMLDNKLQGLNSKLVDTQTEMKATAESTKGFAELIDRSITEMESDSTFKGSSFLTSYRKELEALKSTIGQNGVNADSLKKSIAALSMKYREGQAAIEGAKGAANAFRDSVAALNKKSKGPLDDTIDSLANLISMREKASKIAGKDVFTKELGDSFKIAPKDVENTLGFLKNAAATIRNSKSLAKSYREEMKALRSTMKFSAQETLEYYTASNNALGVEIEALKTKLSVNALLGVAAADEAALRTELASKIEQITSAEEIRARQSVVIANNAITELGYAKQLLGLQAKITASSRARLDAEVDIATQKQLQANLANPNIEDKSISANQALKVFNDTKAQKIDLINQESDMRRKSIEMEYDLLALRFDLLKAQAVINKVALPAGFEEDYKNMLIRAENEALSANSAQRLAEQQKITTEGMKLVEAQKTQVLAGANEGDSSSARLRNAGEAAGGAEGIEGSLASTKDKVASIAGVIQPIKDSLAELGPEGELVNAVAGGALSIANAWAVAGEEIKAGGSALEAGASIANAAATTFGQIGAIMAASSKNRISKIDNEIAAEKKRDGKSKESLQKIKALEAKKEAEKKKAFETNKKMMMAQTVMATAAGIMQAFAQGGMLGFVTGAIIAAMGAAQLAVIAGSSYQSSGGGAGVGGGPSKVSMGDRSLSVDLAKGASPSGEQAFMRGERGMGTGMTNFTPAFTGVKHRASGGATAGYMVGEQGPELFIPETPGVIKPADESAGGQGPMAVSFQINAIDSASVEDMLTSKRGSIIKNLREAANQHGEYFLETVKEDSLT